MTKYHNSWGEEEKFYARKMAGLKPVKDIAKHLGRSVSSVMAWGGRNRVSFDLFGRKSWTNKELATCRRSANKLTAMELCALLGRSENSVRMFCLDMGIPLKAVHRYQPWLITQETYLRENAGKVAPKEMARHLNRDVQCIYQYARSKGIKLTLNRSTWHPDEIKTLRGMILAGKTRNNIPDFPGHTRTALMAKYSVIHREINRKY